MSRHLVFPLSILALFVAVLAAVAAVGTTTTATQQVMPQVHREAGEGYFRLTLPLPAVTGSQPTGFSITVKEGDVWLAHVQSPPPAPMADAEDADDDAQPAGRTLIVTGRYGKAGPVRMALQGRVASDSFKPLLNLAFTLPEGIADNPAVRQAWAEQQDQVQLNADPKGADSFSQYWDLVAAKRYGIAPRRSGMIHPICTASSPGPPPFRNHSSWNCSEPDRRARLSRMPLQKEGCRMTWSPWPD